MQLIQLFKKACFLVSVLCLLCTRPFAQTIYYVSASSGNDMNDGASWSTSFRNINRALFMAKASTAPEVQIWVAEGVYHPTEGITTLPTDARDTSFTFYRGNGIGKALKVYGGFAGTESSISERVASHVTFLDGDLSGGYSFHVAVIARQGTGSDSTVVDGFTFRNGLAAGLGTKTFDSAVLIKRNFGGGLNITSCYNATRLCIRNCNFTANATANTFGGTYYSPVGEGAAVYTTGSSVFFDACKFSDNTITSISSTAINAGGGAIGANASTITIKKCDFIANKLTGGTGTATYVYSNMCGGAIFADYSVLNIDSCHFNGNSVTGGASYSSAGLWCGYGYGGAMYANQCRITCTNTTFANNKAKGTSTTSTISGSGGFGYGGALYLVSTTTSVGNCSFTNDSAVGGLNTSSGSNGPAYGGAMYIAPFSGDSLMVITNSSFSGNLALGGTNASVNGGALHCNTQAIISDCNFSNNAAISGTSGGAAGGAITFGQRNIKLRRSQFSGNKATANSSVGGAIYPSVTTLTLDSCSFERNKANYGGAICGADMTLKLSNSTFFKDSARYGGALYASRSSQNPIISLKNNIYSSEVADSGGGALYIDITSVGVDTILSSVFANNKTRVAGSNGGAIHIIASKHYIVNNTFYGDTATGRGGALRIQGTGGIYTLANNIFYRNSATSLSQDTSLAAVSGFYTWISNSFGVDPVFVNSSDPAGADGVLGTIDDGLSLQACSPAINTGTTSSISPYLVKDVAGSPRIAGPNVDKGAYEAVLVPPITGADSFCIGSSITVSNTYVGGSWASSNTSIATISSTGEVFGVGVGSVTIWYINSLGCMTDTVVKIIKVQGQAAPIAGPHNICDGTTTTLTNSIPGGHWASSSTTIATINGTTGFMGGVNPGSAIITYTVSNSCGTTTDTSIVNVISTFPPPIIGAGSICIGNSTTFTNSSPGGTWSVTPASIATINASTGFATGLTTGIASITYSVTNACGTYNTTTGVSVDIPVAAISGSGIICIGSPVTFTDSSLFGTWSSSNPSVATVNTSGLVIGLSSGNTIITYTVDNACGISSDTIAVSVSEGAGTIIGTSSLCIGGTATMTNAITGGTWSVSPSTIATISGSGLLTALGRGVATVTYTTSTVCGISTTTYTITVDSAVEEIIALSDSVCPGSSVFFTNNTGGGTWSSSNTAVATVLSGIVVGVAAGSATISYTVTNACGTSIAVHPIVVRPLSQCSAAVAGDPGKENEIEVYPNPVTDQINISCPFRAISQLYDLNGRVIIRSDESTISVATIPPGIYMLIVFDDNGVMRRSFRILKK